MVQLLLLDGLAVDERAVRAAQVDEPELIAAALQARVMPTGRRVAEDYVVVGRAAEAHGVVAGAMLVAGVRSCLDRHLGLGARAHGCSARLGAPRRHRHRLGQRRGALRSAGVPTPARPKARPRTERPPPTRLPAAPRTGRQSEEAPEAPEPPPAASPRTRPRRAHPNRCPTAHVQPPPETGPEVEPPGRRPSPARRADSTTAPKGRLVRRDPQPAARPRMGLEPGGLPMTVPARRPGATRAAARPVRPTKAQGPSRAVAPASASPMSGPRLQVAPAAAHPRSARPRAEAARRRGARPMTARSTEPEKRRPRARQAIPSRPLQAWPRRELPTQSWAERRSWAPPGSLPVARASAAPTWRPRRPSGWSGRQGEPEGRTSSCGGVWSSDTARRR